MSKSLTHGSYRLSRVLPESDFSVPKHFDCGNAEISRYFLKQALRDVRAGNCALHVLLQKDGGSYLCIGYFTLVPYSVGKHYAQSLGMTNLPNPVPGYRLVMLGLDKACQGKGLGRRLLAAAMREVVQLKKGAPARMMYLDAEATKQGFYERLGFKHLISDEAERQAHIERSGSAPMGIRIEEIETSISA